MACLVVLDVIKDECRDVLNAKPCSSVVEIKAVLAVDFG